MRHDLGERVWSQRIKTVFAALSNSGRELFFLPRTKENVVENTNTSKITGNQINAFIAEFSRQRVCFKGGGGCLDCYQDKYRAGEHCYININAFTVRQLQEMLTLNEIREMLGRGKNGNEYEYILGATDSDLVEGKFAWGRCIELCEIVEALEANKRFVG